MSVSATSARRWRRMLSVWYVAKPKPITTVIVEMI